MKPSLPTIPLPSLLLVLGVILIWGINFIMVKIGLEQIPPLTLCSLRFFLASFPAILFVPRPNIPFRYIIGYGLATFTVQFALLFTGMAAGVSPGMTAIISQVQVFFAMFFAYLFANQSIKGWQLMGSFVSFLGIIEIGLHCGDASCTVIGFVLVLSASFFWGVGNLISVKLPGANMFGLIIWSSFIAFFPLFGLAYLMEEPFAIVFHPEQLTLSTLLSLAYITYASTHFGYGSWAWLVNQYSMASIAPFALLCPIIALVFSSIILHESFESWKATAAILVILGLSINVFGNTLSTKLKLLLVRQDAPSPTPLD